MNVTFPKTCTAASLALSVCAVSIAFADDASPPVALEVRDVMPATGFSADAVADVLGLRIGMSFAEYEAALAKSGLPLLKNAEQIPDATKFGPQRLGFVAQEGDPRASKDECDANTFVRLYFVTGPTRSTRSMS